MVGRRRGRWVVGDESLMFILVVVAVDMTCLWSVWLLVLVLLRGVGDAG